MTTPPPTTSSSRDIDALLAAFWSQTVPPGPVTTDGLFCEAENLSGCVLPFGFVLEKLVKVPDDVPEIPEITDISIFPHINVHGVNVVKVKLSDDICRPLPKPKCGGLLERY